MEPQQPINNNKPRDEKSTSVELPLSLVTKRKRGRPKKRPSGEPEPTIQVTINPPKPPIAQSKTEEEEIDIETTSQASATLNANAASSPKEEEELKSDVDSKEEELERKEEEPTSSSPPSEKEIQEEKEVVLLGDKKEEEEGQWIEKGISKRTRSKRIRPKSPLSTFSVEPTVKVTVSAYEENKMFFKAAAMELERLHDENFHEYARKKLKTEIEQLRREANQKEATIAGLKVTLKQKNEFIKEKTCGVIPSELVINWMGFKRFLSTTFSGDGFENNH